MNIHINSIEDWLTHETLGDWEGEFGILDAKPTPLRRKAILNNMLSRVLVTHLCDDQQLANAGVALHVATDALTCDRPTRLSL